MVHDRYNRPLRSLRISVTDRCNLRCHYCMPEAEYVWLPREDLLTFEEISRVVDIFTGLGVSKVRITGGEPLLRRELPELIRRLAVKSGVGDLALTTNGVHLPRLAHELKAAGLTRVTVSLDTLLGDRFQQLTRFDELPRVLAGIEAARAVFGTLKIDTVLIKGTNDDEILPLLSFAARSNAELRFIEYMDVGGATQWSASRVVARRDLLERLEATLGTIEPLVNEDWAPADRFRTPDGRVFGIISSTTAPFCATCDRGRLTADGVFLQCLYAGTGLDLRTPLRSGASDAEIAALVTTSWESRADRGAVERAANKDRSAFIPVSALKRDAHLEMHTRGG